MSVAKEFNETLIAMRYGITEYVLARKTKDLDPSILTLRKTYLESCLFRYRKAKADAVRILANKLMSPDQIKLCESAFKKGDDMYEHGRLVLRGER